MGRKEQNYQRVINWLCAGLCEHVYLMGIYVYDIYAIAVAVAVGTPSIAVVLYVPRPIKSTTTIITYYAHATIDA